MARKQDPMKAFEAGRRGIATLYNAFSDSDPAIQLAAARMAAEAANKLPLAIEEELRALGTAHRREAARVGA